MDIVSLDLCAPGVAVGTSAPGSLPWDRLIRFKGNYSGGKDKASRSRGYRKNFEERGFLGRAKRPVAVGEQAEA